MSEEAGVVASPSTDQVARSLSVGRFCLFLVAGATLATGQLFALGPFLPAIGRSMEGPVGLGIPLFAAGYATGMLLLGSLSGRLGAQRVLALSLGGGAVLSIACALSPSAAVLLLLRFTEGVLLGGFPPAAFVATTQRVKPDRRLLANSAMVFGLLGSAGVAGLLSSVLGELVGWRYGLAVYGLLLALAAFVALRLRGLAVGGSDQAHPYRLIPGEACKTEGVVSGLCGAFTMAAFVTTNGMAQHGDQPILALLVVLCVVLLLLSASRVIMRREPDGRRALGLFLVLCGLLVWLFSAQQLVLSLAIVTAGATLVVPASIQQVIAHARRAVPVSVACFTCCLFIGGALSGLAVTGMASASLQTVVIGLVVGLAVLAVIALVRLRDHIIETKGAT